jgi:hypothetical protein
MKKRYKRGLLLSTLTTASLLFASQGFGAFVGDHPAVPLLKWNNGVQDAPLVEDGPEGAVAIGQFDAYSPRATCGACHDEVVDDTTNAAAATDGSLHQGSYHGGGDTKNVVKTQGVENQSTGVVEWLSYNVKAYKHGFVTGRHSQQGRNEDYGHHQRVAVSGKYWASSPGMFGKY